MNKSELYKKLQNADPKILKELKISEEELKYIREKLLNDKLGLTINFTEVDNEEKSNYILLEEEKDLAINAKEKNNHLLIEGDNYHALKALLKTNIKVDVIYIDPPYNTGKEFVYKDDFGVDKVVGSDDPHKHSKWLSFMKKRLELAKELLSEEGVIFVSIDDNEQAYLKVLMDEIFGEENFVASTPRITKTTAADSLLVGTQHEYTLFYARDIQKITFKFFEHEVDTRNVMDEHFEERGAYYAKHTLDSQSIQYGNGSTDFEIIFNGKKFYPGGTEEEFNKRKQGDFSGGKWSWGWGKQLVEWGILNDTLIVKNGRIYVKNYQKLSIEGEKGNYYWAIKNHQRAFRSLELTQSKFTNENGSKELKKIMGGKVFNNPKPVELVKFIVHLVENKSSIILDFFAGSGTTGQAVMELNEEDGGNRRFILITNNEMKHETRDENLIKKNGSTFYIDNSSKNVQVNTLDFPKYGIARAITRERLFRVINGEGSQGEKIEWQYSDTQKSLKNNTVKYLKTKLLNKIEGEFEEIDAVKELYENEFDKDISITDFKE